MLIKFDDSFRLWRTRKTTMPEIMRTTAAATMITPASAPIEMMGPLGASDRVIMVKRIVQKEIQ